MKKLLMVIMLLLVTCLLLPISCGRPRVESESIMIEKEAPPPMAVEREEAYDEAGAAELQAADEERMIVRNGEISLVVKDVVESVDEIGQLAVAMDGYVVSSWISGEGQEMRGRISIRIPDEKFEEAMDKLGDLSVRVESESTNSQDVTEQYIDLQARLKNAEATESQYLALLDRAKDVEDILRIYDSLSRIRREIEQIKGRMQYLERTSSMSLVMVRLEPATTARPLVPVGWSISEAFKSAVRGIAIFGQWLATVLIWLLILVPIWGTVLGIILWRRHQRKNAG